MRNALRWFSAVAYAGALTMLLLKPPGAMPALFPHADKVAHFVALGLLALMLARAMTPARLTRPRLWMLALAALVSAGYAVGMEFAQVHVGRDCSAADALAGAAGIVFALTLWTWLRTRLLLVR